MSSQYCRLEAVIPVVRELLLNRSERQVLAKLGGDHTSMSQDVTEESASAEQRIRELYTRTHPLLVERKCIPPYY